LIAACGFALREYSTMKPLLVLSALLLLAATAPAQDPSKDDLATFKQYLEKNHKGKKWGVGPARLDSKEIQKAYPDQRFYYVYTAQSLPPGAFLPELIERHRKAMDDYTKNYISVTVAISKDGVRPLANRAEDLAKGLIAVKSDDDAKAAASAVLSVCPEAGLAVAPGVMPIESVKVQKTDSSWTCTAQRQFLQGTVTFDADGKLTRVQRQSMVPLPPSAPPPQFPRPRPLPVWSPPRFGNVGAPPS
jgi:hypothetical protein